MFKSIGLSLRSEFLEPIYLINFTALLIDRDEAYQ